MCMAVCVAVQTCKQLHTRVCMHVCALWMCVGVCTALCVCTTVGVCVECRRTIPNSGRCVCGCFLSEASVHSQEEDTPQEHVGSSIWVLGPG